MGNIKLESAAPMEEAFAQVYNYSSQALSNEEMSVLKLGPDFAILAPLTSNKVRWEEQMAIQLK